MLIVKRFILWPLVLLSALLVQAELHAAVFNAAVRVDQVGYLPTESKYGMVAGGAPTGAFDVRRASDAVSVLTGTLAGAFTDADSGDSIRTADFSSVTTTGTYYLDVAGVGKSYNFDIGPSAFSAAYVKAVRGFYGQRCGMAVNLGNVDGVTYSYPACHTSGAASDNPATYHPSSGKTGTRNEVGGWHDAGDYGKYIVNSGISTGELMWTWDFWSDRLTGVSSNIPESGNGTPDVLNEARWNLQWMLKMQDTDGGVWHKVTSANFGSFVLPNLDDSGTRYVIGAGGTAYKSSCSTADFAAVMAIAARLYQPYDATFAATCLAAAQSAYTWAIANPNVFFNNPTTGPAIGTGGYGDGDSSDERLWAAAELFRTTGTAAYNTYVTSNAPGGTLFGSGLQQDWAAVRNLALWTYYFSGQASANAALRTRIYNDTLSAATTIANRTNGGTNGYKVSLSGSGQYIWGSNGAAANYGIFLLVANRMSPNTNYSNAAMNNLHYLLGRNTFNTSYVTHVGSKAFLHPHHRPSGDAAYSGGAPWPGLLSGGPNSTGSTSGDGTTPASAYPAKCWIDAQAAYASNEIAINWQAPLVFLLAYTLPVPVVGTPTQTQTFTSSPTTTATPTPLPCGVPAALRRVNVGGTAFTDGAGNAWSADQLYATGGWGYVAAGTTSATVNPVAGTVDDALYQAQRYAGTLQYRFTVPNGNYTVRLKLAETYWTAAGSRLMNITAEGNTMVSTLDLFVAAPGKDVAYDINFGVNVADGILDLAFVATADNATVAAIQIDTATSGPCSSPTPTPTPSRTPSFSPTATPSVTLTSTPSITRTSTPSITRTATPSASPTATMTPSPTPSITRSATPTGTPSTTRTSTPTASPSATPTATPSDSPTISPTFTDVPPGSTDTFTSTLTLTYSVTSTYSVTLTQTPTDTPSATPSVTPTGTPSNSPVDTPLPGSTLTFTPTITLTATPSHSPVNTPVATFTVTLTASPTATLTITPTRTPVLATPTPSSNLGDPKIIEFAVVPQPVLGSVAGLYVKLEGGAEQLELQVYSRAFIRVSTVRVPGSYVPGWNQAAFLLPELATGTYFIRVAAVHNDHASEPSHTGRLVLLR